MKFAYLFKFQEQVKIKGALIIWVKPANFVE